MPENPNFYTLKDCPQSKDFVWIKWLAITLIVVGFGLLILGLMAEFIYYVTPGEGESQEELFYLGLYETLQKGSFVSFILGFLSLFIWVMSKFIDRLDQFIWLKSSQKDKENIILGRKKNAKNQ